MLAIMREGNNIAYLVKLNRQSAQRVVETLAGTNRYLAASTLVFTSLLYFAVLPYESDFYGGLAVSVFGAAMVGGLADWFAVSALFRRPLGISWRTAVIPRNRQRLMAVIVQMVQEELLSKDSIKRRIEEYDIPQVMLSYLDERGGAKTLKRMVHKLLSDILEKIDPDEAGLFTAKYLRRDAASIRLAPLVRSVGEWTVQTGYDQRIISFIAGELAHIAAKLEFRELIADFLRTVLVRYEGDRERRKLFNSIAGVSPDRLADLLQHRLVDWLLQVKQAEHPLKQMLRQRFCRYLEQIADNQPEHELDQWKNRFFAGNNLINLSQKAIAWLQRQAYEHPQQTAGWFRQADRLIDQMLADFRTDPGQQQRLSDVIRQGLAGFIDSHHDKIGALANERLAQFSDIELVDFIESKIGEDLQIIRVNGSIIGGLTGGLLYCLTIWL